MARQSDRRNCAECIQGELRGPVRSTPHFVAPLEAGSQLSGSARFMTSRVNDAHNRLTAAARLRSMVLSGPLRQMP